MAKGDPNEVDGSEDDFPEPIGPAADDPRLKIPEALRKPVNVPKDPDKGTGATEGIQMGRAWATAMDFVFTILAGAILGWLFDKWRGTNPTGTMIGLGLGFVLAFFRIVRATQKQEAADQERKDRNRRP
jgi:F0F1-type ATP synthase assembly protein I